MESELEARAEEPSGSWEEPLRLLLPFNLLTSLQKALGSGFLRLQLLDVSTNGLTALGPELLTLICLCMLLARNNRLGGPGSLHKGLAQLLLCCSLNLRHNCCQELPTSLPLLCMNQILTLGSNQWQSIPGKRTCGECLYLGGKVIKEIPPELASLPSLNFLVLCDNKIQSVPPRLSHLHSL